MKIKFLALLAALLILPVAAIAQVEGGDAAKGTGGDQPLCVVDPTSTVAADKWSRFACSPGGGLRMAPPTTASLAEVTPAPMVVFQATALPTAAPTPQYEANGDKSNFVENTTNQEAQIFLKGSQTPYGRVQPGGYWYENWAAKGQKLTGGIAVGRTGTLPTTGSIAIGGTR